MGITTGEVGVDGLDPASEVEVDAGASCLLAGDRVLSLLLVRSSLGFLNVGGSGVRWRLNKKDLGANIAA